jgi:hypothetical protein
MPSAMVYVFADNDQAVTVVFDLVEPLRPRRHGLPGYRDAGRVSAWHSLQIGIPDGNCESLNFYRMQKGGVQRCSSEAQEEQGAKHDDESHNRNC